jgi:hypothetical protein
VLAIIVVAAVFFFGGRAVVISIEKGRLVGPKSPEDAAGVVRTRPADILAAVNSDLIAHGDERIDLNLLALARALESEHGSDSVDVRTWVAWAIRNEAGGYDRIFDKLTSSGHDPKLRGLFARQKTDGRYAATHAAAHLGNIQIARLVVGSSTVSDPTGGAHNFFSPQLQDKLYAQALDEQRQIDAGTLDRADAKYAGRITVDANGLRRRWNGYGWVSRGAPSGTPYGLVEFFAPKVA